MEEQWASMPPKVGWVVFFLVGWFWWIVWVSAKLHKGEDEEDLDA
ncbi:hypothetical protein LCGC14_1570030 [marine sediment metagenome]|uniref:Uncharacterized protein n=1 Tax=marine sediment metagenome TaxID=412755 RepID=A0A0F9J689_9ZZZZ